MLGELLHIFSRAKRRRMELFLAERALSHAYVLVGNSLKKYFNCHIVILPQGATVRPRPNISGYP